MPIRTVTTTVTTTGPPGAAIYHPVPQAINGHTTTTTTEVSNVKRRLRLILTGLAQLSFGGLSLIPVLLLGPSTFIVACCTCVAVAGLVGLLGACFLSNKPRASTVYSPSSNPSGTQTITVDKPIFLRFYVFTVAVGLILAVIAALQGIVIVSRTYHHDEEFWHDQLVIATFGGFMYGLVALGFGIFLAINQIVMIACLIRLTRPVITYPPILIYPGIPGATGYSYQAVRTTSPYLAPLLAPLDHVPLHHGSNGGSPAGYPYIDEPAKAGGLPSYDDVGRYDQTQRPSAPPEKT